MNPSINVTANVSGATGGIRQVAKSLTELQNALRETSRGMRKLSDDERAALDALERAVNSADPSTRAVGQAHRALERAGVRPRDGRIRAEDVLNARFDKDAAASERIRRNILQTMAGGVLSEDGQSPAGAGQGGGGSGALGGALGLAKRAALPLMALAGVGSVFGAVRSGMGEGGSMLETLDTFQRQGGLLSDSLQDLRLQTERAAEGLKITTAETSRLITAYARQAGIMDAAAAADSVNAAGGFARSFGLDLGRTGQSFASLEYSGAGDARRMGIIIGETIARTGRFVNSEDFLQAFDRFNQQQGRQTLRPADMAAFGDMLSGVLNFGQKEGLGALTPQLAEELMLRLNSSIAGGGTAGEGSKIFLQSIFAERGIGNVFEREYLQQGGMFQRLRGRDGSETTMLEAVFGRLDRLYGADTLADGTPNFQKRHALGHGFLGGNQWMAKALLGGREFIGDMSGFGDFLKRAGVDPDAMSPTAYAELAKLYGAYENPERFGGNVAEVEESLRRSTNPMTRDRLREIDGLSGDDRLMALTQILGQAGREDNLATDAITAQVNLSNAIVNLSEEGIPAIVGLKTAIVQTAARFGINATETEDVSRAERFSRSVENQGVFRTVLSSNPAMGSALLPLLFAQRRTSATEDVSAPAGGPSPFMFMGLPPHAYGMGAGVGVIRMRAEDDATGKVIGEAEIPLSAFPQPTPAGMPRR